MCHLILCWAKFTPHILRWNISGGNVAFSWWICPRVFCLMAKSVSSPGGAAFPWVHPGAMLEGTMVCPEVWAALVSGQSPRLWLNQSLLHPSRPHSSLGHILHPEAINFGQNFASCFLWGTGFWERLIYKDNTAPKIILPSLPGISSERDAGFNVFLSQTAR